MRIETVTGRTEGRLTEERGLILGDAFRRFVDTVYGFSVEYPRELEYQVFDEEAGGESIVFQKPDERIGFQIFISLFQDEQISTSYIQEFLPSAVIEDPQEIIIGEDIRGVIFWSSDARIGRTREVWFPYNGYLYQVTTYEYLDSWLAEIMSSWRFIR